MRKSVWICPQCLPNLIHHPEKLTEKLAKVKEIDLDSLE
jgi:hypothetical protein